MSKLILKLINKKKDKSIFIKEVQEAFQKAYVDEFGEYNKTILPTEDIEESFNEDGSEIYFAEIDGKRVGGML